MATKAKEPTSEMISSVFSMMGKKGGPARAKALTAKRRSEIAKKAASKRWGSSQRKDDEFFFMANLFPQDTGLPFVVWISERGFAQHDVRIKVARGPKAIPGELISVAIRPDVRLIQGRMKASDLELLKRWIEPNRKVIIDYWNGELPTSEALKRLKKL